MTCDYLFDSNHLLHFITRTRSRKAGFEVDRVISQTWVVFNVKISISALPQSATQPWFASLNGLVIYCAQRWVYFLTYDVVWESSERRRKCDKFNDDDPHEIEVLLVLFLTVKIIVLRCDKISKSFIYDLTSNSRDEMRKFSFHLRMTFREDYPMIKFIALWLLLLLHFFKTFWWDFYHAFGGLKNYYKN